MKQSSKKYDKRLRSEFLPEALEIIEKPISPLGHFTIIIITIILISVVVWACFGKMDEVVIASTMIVPKDGVQVVQPLYEGVITDILVDEGEKVIKDQQLMILDTSTGEINLESIQENISELKLQNSLYKLMLNEEDVSGYAAANGINNVNELEICEMAINMQMEYISQRSQYDTQCEQYKKQITIEQNSLAKLITNKDLLIKQYGELSEYQSNLPENKALDNYIKQISDLNDDLTEYKKLLSGNAITQYQYEQKKSEYDEAVKQYELQQVRAEKEISGNAYELSNLQNQIDLAQKDIDVQRNVVDKANDLLYQVDNQIKTLEYEYKQNISNAIVANNGEISRLNTEYKKQSEYQTSNTLISPVDGTIQTIAVKTVGGVVTSAQSVIAIIPDNAELIAEAEVLNKDIGFIFVGQEASLKIDAFSFQKYGTIKGEVIYISPNAIENDSKGLVYPVKIAFNAESFNVNNKNVDIVSGMSGTAEIKLEDRPIIEFFLEPIFEYFDNGLKVR